MRDVKYFRIIVDNRENRAILRCVTYRIGNVGRDFVSAFREEAPFIDNFQFSIPGNRVATFQEELRATKKVYEVVPEDIGEIEKWIEGKMKDAYGNDTIVTITEVATNE